MKFAKTSKGTTPQTTEKQSKKKSSTPKRVIPQGASASQVQQEMNGPAMILPKQATPGTCGLENIFTPPQNVSTQKVGMRNKRGNVDDGMSSSSSASGFSTPNIFKKKKQSPPPKPTTAHVDDRLLNIQETLSTAVQQMNKNSERIAIACESMRDHIKTGTKYWKWVATYMQTKLLEKQQIYHHQYEDEDNNDSGNEHETPEDDADDEYDEDNTRNESVDNQTQEAENTDGDD